MSISSDKHQDLKQRMARLGVREADLVESFVRSGGKGGQNVNKVATCVVLSHPPSGIMVKCQQERTQAQNRYLARQWLLDKLQVRLEGAASAAAQEAARIRRQKRRRSRRAKERMLANKHATTERKRSRGRVRAED